MQEDLGYLQRCKKDYRMDIVIYNCILAKKRFFDLKPENRTVLFNYYKHLRECDICMSNQDILLELFEKGKLRFPNWFKPDTLKANMIYLEELVRGN
ncbi:MAG: hypothetical protein Q7S56_00180 [Nanoarchaeota archaeon]|nr:hypothetical protein [Nanoarchaeota archaeon]